MRKVTLEEAIKNYVGKQYTEEIGEILRRSNLTCLVSCTGKILNIEPMPEPCPITSSLIDLETKLFKYLREMREMDENTKFRFFEAIDKFFESFTKEIKNKGVKNSKD